MLHKFNAFRKNKSENTSDADIVDTTAPANTKPGMISSLKAKAVAKMMEKKLAGLPPAQRDMLMQAITNNPDFFESIAQKIKEEEKRNGGNQMAAAMKVMREHQGELQNIMMKK